MTPPLVERLTADATAIASSKRHNFVGTEHMLVALLADQQGFAATVLSKAGLDPTAVAAAALEGLRVAPGPEAPAPALTRFAERALSSASQSADRAGRAVEERDLLAAVIAQPKGRLAQALRGNGSSLAALQAVLGVGANVRESPPPPKERKQPTAPAEKAAAQERKRPAERPRTAPVPPPPKEERVETPRRIARPEPPRPFPWMMLLLIAIPASIALKVMGGPPVALFVTACLGVLPLAALMGEATESLADRTGPTVGGLLNATFGNMAELIIAVMALRAGLVELVKASITGSILGNLLLILGLSFVAGGGKSALIRFSRTNAGMSSAMLALAVVGLVFPTLFHAVHGTPDHVAELYMSEAVAVILIITYGLSLLFSLKTHRALFGGGDHPAVEPRWGVGASVGILAAATIGIVVQSELLVGVVEAVTQSLGMTETFLGLIIIPLIGNAAEHATAIVVARKGQMDLALQIALGSSTQVALLIAPILVFVGLALATPMSLVFPVFDVMALAVSTIVIAIITLDGETHWFEGAQLLALYAMMAAAAYFI